MWNQKFALPVAHVKSFYLDADPLAHSLVIEQNKIQPKLALPQLERV